MPIVALHTSNPFVDGRQSDRALEIRAGVERHFDEMGWATLPELALDTGRRADIVALSPKGDVTIVEIKSSVADFRADNKWPDYRVDCDALLFATLADVPADIFPENAGLMICDAWGAHITRDAPEHRMTPARRKKLHLRFARAAAFRLTRCCAHVGVEGETFREEDARVE
ncbi:MAG: MmcB family DNA repair protein [Pseudomonadota bacterium]